MPSEKVKVQGQAAEREEPKLSFQHSQTQGAGQGRDLIRGSFHSIGHHFRKPLTVKTVKPGEAEGEREAMVVECK